MITGCLAVCILIFECVYLLRLFFRLAKVNGGTSFGVCSLLDWIELKFKVHNYRGSLDNMILMHAHQK